MGDVPVHPINAQGRHRFPKARKVVLVHGRPSRKLKRGFAKRPVTAPPGPHVFIKGSSAWNATPTLSSLRHATRHSREGGMSMN